MNIAANLSSELKVTTAVFAIVASIAAAFLWLFSTFETADASEAKWTQHERAIACRTVYDLEKDIEKYLERLRFDTALTDDDRKWIRERIDVLNKKIERLDPEGDC